ncbi:MAG: M56 family metallopeptidase [Bacteroidota bacterium]
MISYLITSSILLLPAWLLYRLVLQHRANAIQRKSFLYLAIMGSLVAPLSGGWGSWELPQPDPVAASHPFGYKIEQGHLQQYCRCENPNYGHRVQYRANIWYQLLLENKHWLGWLVLAAMAWSALRLLWQVNYLRRLVRHAELESQEIDGQKFFLLYSPDTSGVGAFQLRHAYLIWDEQLAHLTPEERTAVFRHELSHLRQYNTLEKAGLSLVQCIWFFHPLFYWIRRELDLLSEFIADHAAADLMPNRKAYAHLLLKIKSQQLEPLVAGFAHQALRQRIEFLLGQRQRMPLLVWLLGLLLFASIQLMAGHPLSSQVERQLSHLQTYEKISQQVHADTKAAVYCTDCETVCTPSD